MATHPSPQQDDDEDDELDPLDRVLDAFVAFTGRPLRDAEREAMRGMLVSVVQEAAEVRYTHTTGFVDHVRLADALYSSIEDAHAREIVMILKEGGVEGPDLQSWLAKKLDEERSARRRR